MLRAVFRQFGKKKAGHKALLKIVSDNYTGLNVHRKGDGQRSSRDVVSVEQLALLFAYGRTLSSDCIRVT